MSDGPEWFAPKRYGYGAGLPISWQGWLITIAALAAFLAVTMSFQDKPLVMVAILVPIIVAFVVISARTTRGGWRWRWGDKD